MKNKRNPQALLNFLKRRIKKSLLKTFAIVTKDTNNNNSIVTIGARKASTRYKSLYLGKETYVTNYLKFSLNIVKEYLKDEQEVIKFQKFINNKKSRKDRKFSK